MSREYWIVALIALASLWLFPERSQAEDGVEAVSEVESDGQSAAEPNDEGAASHGPSFLSPKPRGMLTAALRRSGITLEDLRFSRDYVNYGLQEPRDHWRLTASQQTLKEPMLLPDLAAAWSLTLSDDLGGGRMPRWTGFHQLALGQLAPTPASTATERKESEQSSSQGSGCEPAPGSAAPPGIIAQSLASEEQAGRKWSRREARSLNDRMNDDLDVLLGSLLSRARTAHCQVRAALSSLSPEQRRDVVSILEATLWGDPAQTATEDEEERRFSLLTSTWDAIDRQALLEAGSSWNEAILAASLELSALPASAWPASPMILPTDLGEVWVGSADNNSGSGDPVLLVDPGGDDNWRIASSREALPSEGLKPVRGWIDLGGNDAWQGGQGGPGGALFSIAAGIDLDGNDSYRSGRLSQGAAAFGYSAWLDQRGTDRYMGTVAVQGFAAFGAAILRDAGEDGDVYEAGFLAQAASHTEGFAVLHDGGGSDRYLLGGTFEDNPSRLPGHYSSCGQGFSIGMRPYAGGGVAWLLDESGHDQYVGGLWVQGSSYWHSLAALVDRSGNDLYTATQYSQGSGIHLSSAGLFDGGGDDRYLLPHLGQGSGHDLAVSWLIDDGGDDLYAGINLLQGASITNAASFFVDARGDDTYMSGTANSRGQASDARGFGAVGVFLDQSGEDRYLDGEKQETAAGALELRGDHGIFVDGIEVEQPDSTDRAVESDTDPEEVANDDGATAQEDEEVEPPSLGARELLLNNVLYIAPSEDTEAAVARLAEGGARVLRLLLPLTSADKILRSYTIERVIERIIKDAPPGGLLKIAESVARAAQAGETNAADASVRWHLSWLGKLAKADLNATEYAVASAEQLRGHPAWRVRKAAWTLLRDVALLEGLKLADEDREAWAVKASLALQDDPIVEVRAAAARALTSVAGPGVAPTLVKALLEHSFDLRDSAEAALVAILERSDGIAVARALFPVASAEVTGAGPGRDAALRLLGASGHRDAWDVIRGALSDTEPATRTAALDGALALRPRGLKKALEERLKSEQDATLRGRLERELASAGLR